MADIDSPHGGDADGEQYRTCPECASDCPPETLVSDGRVQIAFICSEHGVHTMIDPFADTR